MATSPSISVVIRTYTAARWDSLVAALSSLSTQILAPSQVVVVVDHNPHLLDRVRSAFPALHVVENHYPQGSSGAWNSGVLAATREIVAFIDDDAVAQPDWLARLTGPYRDPQVAGVGGRIDPFWQAGRPAWFPEEFDWVVGCTYKGLPESLAPVRNLIGCNMSFRRSVFELVGGFRDGMGHVGSSPVGCDETEFCIRLRQHEQLATLLYEPLAVVHHLVPPERATFAYFRRRCALEGRSKALVSRWVGAHDGLASERAHALKVLPPAVVRSLADAFFRRDRAGLHRAGALIAGFSITAASYVRGRFASRRAASESLAPPEQVPI